MSYTSLEMTVADPCRDIADPKSSFMPDEVLDQVRAQIKLEQGTDEGISNGEFGPRW